MRLIINGNSLSITHMGPDFLFVQSPTEYAPGVATIVLRVDRSQRRWTVRLPGGIRPGHTQVLLSK